MNKKLSLAELKSKANALTTNEALNAIKGGAEEFCHNGYGKTLIIKCEPAVRDNTEVR